MKLFQFCTQPIQAILAQFKTSSSVGLTSVDVEQRRGQYGFNEINLQEQPWWKLFLSQWKSPFIYLLLAAAGIAFFITHDRIEGGMIIGIVILNSLLGFYQEYNASKTLQSLKTYLVSHEDVLRDSAWQSISVRDLVPGDIVLLEPGDVIPADIRIIQEQGLTIDESPITGEAVPILKTSNALEKEPHHHSQATNLCFAGTTVVAGKGVGVVLATGKNTSLGVIAQLISETDRVSTFAKGIARFSTFITRMVIITVASVFIAHLLIKGTGLNAEFFIFALTLSVTIIPEVLPTIITSSLAYGAHRLAQNKVVVKRLTAIEDLGSIQVLCTDKTGTLTENKLTVADVYGAVPRDVVFHAGIVIKQSSLVNKKHASSAFDEALWAHLTPEERARVTTYTSVASVPFEPARRRSSAVVLHEGQLLLIVRGAYEELIKHAQAIPESDLQAIARWVAHEGLKGRRVIGVAQKIIQESDLADLKAAEFDLAFIGIISFEDPIKSSTFAAIKQAKQLGVQFKMLSGDSPEVAGYVGAQIGIAPYVQDVITGDEFSGMMPDEKHEAVLRCSVFARISPQQKYEIIQLLQQKYEVGFLGDGINDAPALKIANVALVVQGAADIAQEAADIVLLKKSLMVIVQGIKEGRTIFANTVKYIKASMSGNFGNFYALAIASLFLDYLPMLPLQILLVNLLTDFPMLALATDEVDDTELKEPTAYNTKDIALIAVVLGLVSTIFDFLVFFTFYQTTPKTLQTCWFITSVLTEFLFILSIRTKQLVLTARPPSRILLGAMGGVMLITLVTPFTALGQSLFGFTAPTYRQLLQVLAILGGYFVTTEYAKLLYYRLVSRNNQTPTTSSP